jgi:hypothetical protein
MNRRTFLLTPLLAALAKAQTRRQISGIYPHLAMFNSQGECGTGAVVPWAAKLWTLTYSPHQPQGSDDKLYEIDAQLNQTIRPESIGGTPANRMIHRESQQLFIGPYAISDKGEVRAIPYAKMFGRPTGNARHLTDPVNKIYTATMEEGFYEVDVKTLAAKQLYEDANLPRVSDPKADIAGPLLPGYHGKGFYSGQGRTVYANNGEVGGGNLPPDTPSGCLAEWDGKNWKVIRRNQFTEVTGPGGLYGNPNPAKDPIWSIGWDHRSLILMLLDNGQWHSYRLPKAAHTYDGAHGWNTEWPRIRDIGEKDLLMTMHGMFWRFPKTFSLANSAGIAPRSTYIRIIGDFARWQDRIVMGCDDTAQNEFFNTRRAKGKIAGPGQSQSNLWFVPPARLDQFGPPIGHGGVWVKDDIAANTPSEPFLFSGFERRMLHLSHQSDTEVLFHLEVDRAGNGTWAKLRDVRVPARGYLPVAFSPKESGTWVRLRPASACRKATAFFEFAAADKRQPAQARPKSTSSSIGFVWARGEKRGTLLLAQDDSLYELDATLNFQRREDPKTLAWMKENLAPPKAVLAVDAASVIYTDEANRRWRLPKGDPSFDATPEGTRISREVSTERDLFNAHGTFYELPSNNAGGVAVIRPICTHNLPIRDYCSWRGFTVLSGLPTLTLPAGEFIRSSDGKASLWLGASDDLWQFGKAVGDGGPWHETAVKAGVPSDPYLFNGYDAKTLRLQHKAAATLKIRVEFDITGNGLWVAYQTFEVAPGKTFEHRFPTGFNAYWLRTVALSDSTVTATLAYR